MNAQTGWRGWGDSLGTYTKWTRTSILAFLSSILPLLDHLEPSEIYAILRQNGSLSAVNSLERSSPLRRLVEAALHQDKAGVEPRFRDLGLETLDDEEIQPSSDEGDVIVDTAIPSLDGDVGLPDLAPQNVFSGLDDLKRSVVLSDSETIEFLITKAVGRLWARVLRSENVDQDLSDIQRHKQGSYSFRVRERFLNQFNGANQLALPKGYSFRKKGEPLPPNLMQRLIAYQVIADKRVGNWSGTGAGKTLGAILASRAVKAKLAVVVALNNTILDLESGWAAEVLNAFPKSNVIIKERGTLTIDGTKPTISSSTMKLSNCGTRKPR